VSQADLPTKPARPLEKTLPSDYYLSPEIYARERERIRRYIGERLSLD